MDTKFLEVEQLAMLGFISAVLGNSNGGVETKKTEQRQLLDFEKICIHRFGPRNCRMTARGGARFSGGGAISTISAFFFEHIGPKCARRDILWNDVIVMTS